MDLVPSMGVSPPVLFGNIILPGNGPKFFLHFAVFPYLSVAVAVRMMIPPCLIFKTWGRSASVYFL